MTDAAARAALARRIHATAHLTGEFRKAAKDYGTRRLAEGGEVDGRRLAVVEDVVTSGGQLIASCRDLRERGAEIVRVRCVIDREAGGAANLAEQGLDLHALFTMSEVRRAAKADR